MHRFKFSIVIKPSIHWFGKGFKYHCILWWYKQGNHQNFPSGPYEDFYSNKIIVIMGWVTSFHIMHPSKSVCLLRMPLTMLWSWQHLHIELLDFFCTCLLVHVPNQQKTKYKPFQFVFFIPQAIILMPLNVPIIFLRPFLYFFQKYRMKPTLMKPEEGKTACCSTSANTDNMVYFYLQYLLRASARKVVFAWPFHQWTTKITRNKTIKWDETKKI